MSHHRIKSKSGGYSLRKDWRIFWPVIAVLALPLILSALVMVKTSWTTSPQRVTADRDLHLDFAKLHPDRLHFFDTSVSSQRVRFVIERTQDNVIHVAVAACKFCYRERRSNRVQDGAVMCGRCKGPMNFASTKTEGRANSCDLSEIPHQQTQQSLIVSVHDITQTISRLAQQ
jgi:uncharacterized membrane protein